MTVTDLLASLTLLRGDLSEVRLPLPVPDGATAAADVAALVNQLDDYLLPRLRDAEAPLLAVVGGSTGSGKSTLVNSLVGHTVTTAGVLRPTTRHPVLAHHPDDAQWFDSDRILPRLPRITGVSGGGPAGVDEVFGVRLVGVEALPGGFGILDAPDLDSVSGANRELAALLMAAADLWLFVTTASRYADAVPWAALRAAQTRNAAVVVVLNRVPSEALEAVTDHVRELLAAEGLSDAPLFVLPEVGLHDGMLDATVIAPIHDWLFTLVADAANRTAIARRTLDGAIGHLLTRMPTIAQAVTAQLQTVDRLCAAASAPYARAVEELVAASTDGSLMRGEVLARWQEFVGTGELLKRLEVGVGRLRDRMRTAWRGSRVEPEQVAEAIESRMAAMIIGAAHDASRAAEGAWRADPAGHALLGTDDLARASVTIADRAAEAVRGWQDDLLDLIRTEGADKRATARVMAFGVNGTAAALMVVVFSMTGGLTGAEIGIAGGSAVLAQKVLEAVFGEAAVRRMSERAAESLTQRVEAVMVQERARFDYRVAALDLDPDVASRLSRSTAAVSRAHRAAVLEQARSAVARGTGTPAGESFWWDPAGVALADAVGSDLEPTGSGRSGVAGAIPGKGRWRRRLRQWWQGSS